MLLIAVVNRASLLLLDLNKKKQQYFLQNQICNEFQVLHKILPKLNSIHAPNIEHMQLVDKTFLQSLEHLFFPGRRTRSIIALTIIFSKNKFRDFKRDKIVLEKVYLSNLTNLSYQYIVPSKYRLSIILQLRLTVFLSIYRWFRLQLLQSKKHL